MGEIIDDPAFGTLSREGSRWELESHAGVITRPTVEAGVLRLEISGTSGANWHGELRYTPFAVAEGDTLALSFDARSEQPFTFSIWLGQRDAPYASIVREEDRFQGEPMPPEWKTFHHRWRAVKTEKNARLNFVLGQVDNVVEIRIVSLRLIGTGGCG